MLPIDCKRTASKCRPERFLGAYCASSGRSNSRQRRSIHRDLLCADEQGRFEQRGRENVDGC